MTSNKQFGTTYWFTGLSGAGKSTLAGKLFQSMQTQQKQVHLIDGDSIRNFLPKLGFSIASREQHNRYVAYLCKTLNEHQINVVVATISPFHSIRQFNREHIPNYIEIFVDCSIEVLVKRDPKGLYRKALEGEIDDFTGISQRFDVPCSPDLHIITSTQTPEDSFEEILTSL